MSVADLYDLELLWPSLGPTDVIATGTFDQWSSSIRLVRGDTGFSGTVKVPWGQKLWYKFIVDGEWECRNDRPHEDDGNGNMNNVFQVPNKPEFAAPARLSIPLAGAPSEAYSAVENMVTAVEFIPPAELAATEGSLPLPVPQITVEGLSQGPSPVNESILNTAAATEGNISPASVTPAEVVPLERVQQVPASQPTVSILPLSDYGSVPLAAINGNGEASEGIMTHAPIQFTKGKRPATDSVPENGEQVVVIPESAAPQPTTQLDDPPTATVHPAEKQPEVDPPKTAAQQDAAPPAITTTSTLASSTATQKKRRSLLARIKHIFERNKDKQEKKEKTKR